MTLTEFLNLDLVLHARALLLIVSIFALCLTITRFNPPPQKTRSNENSASIVLLIITIAMFLTACVTAHAKEPDIKRADNAFTKAHYKILLIKKTRLDKRAEQLTERANKLLGKELDPVRDNFMKIQQEALKPRRQPHHIIRRQQKTRFYLFSAILFYFHPLRGYR